MSDEKLTCQWCGAEAVIMGPAMITGRCRWTCDACSGGGPWRPTRDEAVATMGQVTASGPLHSVEVQVGDIVRRMGDDFEYERSRADDLARRLGEAEAELAKQRACAIGMVPGYVHDQTVDTLGSEIVAKVSAEAELAELREALDAAPSPGVWLVLRSTGYVMCNALGEVTERHATASGALLSWHRSVKGGGER